MLLEPRQAESRESKAQSLTLSVVDSSDPTILWRMTRGKSTAHATVFPGDGRTTVTWYFDGQMDRAENYDTLELALARAEHIHGILLRDGWTDVT